jgi:hypothetical protein
MLSDDEMPDRDYLEEEIRADCEEEFDRDLEEAVAEKLDEFAQQRARTSWLRNFSAAKYLARPCIEPRIARRRVGWGKKTRRFFTVRGWTIL